MAASRARHLGLSGMSGFFFRTSRGGIFSPTQQVKGKIPCIFPLCATNGGEAQAPQPGQVLRKAPKRRLQLHRTSQRAKQKFMNS